MEDVDREYYSNQIELLETMQLVWSLCEILFIDIMPGETWTTVIESVVEGLVGVGCLLAFYVRALHFYSVQPIFFAPYPLCIKIALLRVRQMSFSRLGILILSTVCGLYYFRFCGERERKMFLPPTTSHPCQIAKAKVV